MGVKVTQPSDDVRKQLRAAYDHDASQLIAASQVIALNFQTVAAANNWWRWHLRPTPRIPASASPCEAGSRGLGNAANAASG